MIKFKQNPQDLKSKYSVFASKNFAFIANELQMVPSTHFTNKKLDLDKFYTYLKSKGFKAVFKDMKDIMIEVAPILGIVDCLKLTKEEKKDLAFAEKYIYNRDSNIDYFTECEIFTEPAETDHILRSMYGETTPAIYRIDRQLTPHDRNLLRAAYSIKYGEPTKTPWKNYLDARAATLGHILKYGKSMECTVEPGDYRGEVYTSDVKPNYGFDN